MHVINLVYPGKVLPMDGFGYLVPAHEPELVLGVVFDSCVFPEQVYAQNRKSAELTFDVASRARQTSLA